MPLWRRWNWRTSFSPEFAVAGGVRMAYMLGLRHL